MHALQLATDKWREPIGKPNRFYGGTIDILIATTIIENGLDVPNANTIFINNLIVLD